MQDYDAPQSAVDDALAALDGDRPAAQQAPAPDAREAAPGDDYARPAADEYQRDEQPTEPEDELTRLRREHAELRRKNDSYGDNLERARRQAAEQAAAQVRQEYEQRLQQITQETDAQFERRNREAQEQLRAEIRRLNLTDEDAKLAEWRLETQQGKEALERQRAKDELARQQLQQEQAQFQQQRAGLVVQEMSTRAPEVLENFAAQYGQQFGLPEAEARAYMRRKEVIEEARRAIAAGPAAYDVYGWTLARNIKDRAEDYKRRDTQQAARNREEYAASGAARRETPAGGGGSRDTSGRFAGLSDIDSIADALMADAKAARTGRR